MRTTRAGQPALLLLDAVGVLAATKIPYAVIGAMAASIHGIVRASMDADAVLSLTIQEARSLEREFRAVGFQTELRRGDPDDPIVGVAGARWSARRGLHLRERHALLLA
ncbi:MAG TPA: hypothetical protein VFN79_09540 [Steroidobacteraceae bacterium]|nr:hypothetical protein [Steroidobacteraceae bacterium]